MHARYVQKTDLIGIAPTELTLLGGPSKEIDTDMFSGLIQPGSRSEWAKEMRK